MRSLCNLDESLAPLPAGKEKLAYVIRCPGTIGVNDGRIVAAAAPGTLCRQEIPYPLCRKIAQLSAEERACFETQLSSNLVKVDPWMGECTKCKTLVVNEQKILRVSCPFCTKMKQAKEFCWRCTQDWKGPAQDNCGNLQCQSDLVQQQSILDNAPLKVIVGGESPSIRMCPACTGCLIMHEKVWFLLVTNLNSRVSNQSKFLVSKYIIRDIIRL